MTRLAAILALALATSPSSAQQSKPGDLVPVEAGTADTSATQTTLRVMPVELSESTNFLRLYGVAGRPDLLVRSHGGTYAVFDQGQYVTWKGASLPVWPSGTQFYIGRPDFSRVRAPGIRMGKGSRMLSAPGIDVAQRKVDPRAPDHRAPDTRPPVPTDRRLPDMRITHAPVDTRIDPHAPPKPRPRSAPAEPAPDPSEPRSTPEPTPKPAESAPSAPPHPGPAAEPRTAPSSEPPAP